MKNQNGYQLAKRWYEMVYNREGVKPIHHAIFFWLVELSNRLKWEDEFGIPTFETMAALGISNTKTYYKALDKLEEIGVFKYIEKSKNQHTATRIAMLFFDIAPTIAPTTASTQHCPSTAQALPTYTNSKTDKTIETNETTTTAKAKPPQGQISEWIEQLKADELFREQVAMKHQVFLPDEFENLLNEFVSLKLALEELNHKSFSEFRRNFLYWIGKNLEAKKRSKSNNGKTRNNPYLIDEETARRVFARVTENDR